MEVTNQEEKDKGKSSLLPPNYTLSRFLPTDIKLLKQVNVDYLSETYSKEYYLNYLIKYPTLCNVIHYQDSNSNSDNKEGEGEDPQSKECKKESGLWKSLLFKMTNKGEVDEHEQLAAYILGRTDYTTPIKGKGDHDDHNRHINRSNVATTKYLYGHVSAMSVGPQHRRQGLATTLMKVFEKECERLGCWYVDLFVRPSNQIAVEMYRQMGYVTYRRISGYYGGDLPEDAFDMRKSLKKDSKCQFTEGASEYTIIPADELDDS